MFTLASYCISAEIGSAPMILATETISALSLRSSEGTGPISSVQA